MTGRYASPSGSDLPLLPAREDIVFAYMEGRKLVPLRYSEWNSRRIVLSQEGAQKVRNEILVSVTIGDFHTPWVRLEGEIYDGGEFVIATSSRLLDVLYQNQGSVAKTLNLVGGPLSSYPRKVSEGIRKFAAAFLVLFILTFLVSFGIYKSEHYSQVLENKTQTVEMQKSVNRERVRIAGHEKQKEALEKETTLLTEQYRLALVRQETLQKGSDQGFVRGDALYLATLQSHTLSLQISEKRRELTKLNDELIAWNQLLEEQKTLREQSDTLARSSYWQWLKGFWQ